MFFFFFCNNNNNIYIIALLYYIIYPIKLLAKFFTLLLYGLYQLIISKYDINKVIFTFYIHYNK